MQRSTLMKVGEVAEVLGTSKSHAYKVVQKLNHELDKAGYITVSGKVNRAYFEEKVYGMREGHNYAGI